MIDLTTYALLRKQIATAASGISDVRVEGDELVFVLVDGHEVRMAIPATEIRDAVVRDDVLVLTLEDGKEVVVDATLTQSGQAADAKVTGDALACKLTEPSTGLAVGKYFRIAAIDENGHAVLEAVDLPSAPVQDVQVAGTSIVADGVANVPIADKNKFGLTTAGSGIGINSQGQLYLNAATQAQISARSGVYNAIPSANLDYAVKAAMCDGKGAAWTSDEQAAARERMGCYNGFTVLMDEVISEEAQNISFVLPSNASEFIAYFESYNTAAPYTGTPYLLFENVGNVNPISTMYSYFGATVTAGAINIKGIQKCVIINDEDVCVEYAAVSLNAETTNQTQARSGRVGIAKRTSNKIEFHFTDQSFPIGTRFLVLVRCK